MDGEIQPPNTRSTPLCRSPYAPITHFKPLSRLFFPPPSNLPSNTSGKPTKRKERRKAATSPPFVALSSTKFNPTSFNLRLELNAPLNRIKPKFNPLQPFAHFVLSPIFSQSTRNSLIYRHSTSFRLTPTLYISFSCPYYGSCAANPPSALSSRQRP